MWGVLAGILVLTGLRAVTTKAGSGRFASAVATFDKAFFWITDASRPGIPDVAGADVGGVNYTAADVNRLIAEATAQVARYCTPGAPTGPGSQCAAAHQALATANATAAGTAG
ncbi:MAG: hypothetical protein ACRDOE_02690 [Streptosporangiaceae bacterium]